MSRPVSSELLSFCAGLIGFGNEEGDFVARFEVLEAVFLRIRLVGRDVFEVRGTFIFRSKQSSHRNSTQDHVPENSAIAFVRLPGSCSLSMRVLSLTVEQVVSQHSAAMLCSCSVRSCFGQVT